MKQFADAILTLTHRARTVITTQQSIITILESFRQEVHAGFAAQAERHHEMVVRDEKLACKSNPPEEEN